MIVLRFSVDMKLKFLSFGWPLRYTIPLPPEQTMSKFSGGTSNEVNSEGEEIVVAALAGVYDED